LVLFYDISDRKRVENMIYDQNSRKDI
jgi:hypothetical protein